MKRILFLPLFYYRPLIVTQKMKAGAPEILVNIEPSKSYQTIEGWGSSLCWWAGQVSAWDQAKINTI